MKYERVLHTVRLIRSAKLVANKLPFINLREWNTVLVLVLILNVLKETLKIFFSIIMLGIVCVNLLFHHANDSTNPMHSSNVDQKEDLVELKDISSWNCFQPFLDIDVLILSLLGWVP